MSLSICFFLSCRSSPSPIVFCISLSSWCFVFSSASPTASTVESSRPLLFCLEKSWTLSCGRNWQRLSTWILKCATTFSTSFCVVFLPLTAHWLLFSWFHRLLITTFSSSGTNSSTSTAASCSPSFMNSAREVALPSTEVLPASPRQMPLTMVDLPEPLGPMMTLRLGPARNSVSEYWEGGGAMHQLN